MFNKLKKVATAIESEARIETVNSRSSGLELGTTTSYIHNPNIIKNDVDVADAEVLNKLGYKQEFKREFSIWSTFGVAFSVLGVLPSIATTLAYAAGYVSFIGLTWGWIVPAIFIQFVGLSMAELCSSLPTAGGLYYAAAVLAPDGWGPICAWIVGWSNFIGQATFVPSVDWGLASMILGCASIKNPDYTPKDWHTYLLFLALIFTHAIITSLPTKFVAKLNLVSTVFNLLLLLIFYIAVPAASKFNPKTNNAHTAWIDYENGTEWPKGIAFLMSFMTCIWTMCGYDAAFHLSEECSNANVAAPQALRFTVHLGGLLGFFAMLVIAYTARDTNEIVNSPIGQPMASFLQQVMGDNGALGIMSLIIVALWLVGQGCMVGASRVVYAYSRDDVLPFSKYLSYVHPSSSTPIVAVWFLWLIGALLGLLGFNTVAITAIFSVGAIAQYIAFTIPVALKLMCGSKFRPGPFYMGAFSIPINLASCAFVLVMVPILCFPATRNGDLDAQVMNWTCLVYGGPIVLALTWYAISARKWFKGPKINVDDAINVPVVMDSEKANNIQDSSNNVHLDSQVLNAPSSPTPSIHNSLIDERRSSTHKE